jgi:uncharacterized surface protein with fasciclin (FAS1) repeats
MKTNAFTLLLALLGLMVFSCAKQPSDQPVSEASNAPDGGQSRVQDSESQKNVVQVAMASPDHSTLVTAIKAAELVDALSNDGFNKLPEGTVEDLLKPEQKEQLQNILQFHVAVGVYKKESLRDGQVLGMVNGDNVTFGVSGDKVTINGANIIASAPASNGIIHIIDAVLLPK